MPPLTDFQQRLNDMVKWFKHHADPHMSPEKFVDFATTAIKNLIELHVLFALGLGVEAEKAAAAQTKNLILSMKLDERSVLGRAGSGPRQSWGG